MKFLSPILIIIGSTIVVGYEGEVKTGHNRIVPQHQGGDVKPGHDMVKEYHMHPYWFQTNPQQVVKS